MIKQIRSIAFLLMAGLMPGLPIMAIAAQADAADDAEESIREAAAEGSGARRVLGWVENVRVFPDRMLMKAKLDPGARSSAIHAENIEEFMNDDRRMVRFTILKDHDDPDSARIVLERPVVREVRIKMRNSARHDVRLAVRLEFCLAGERHNTLFTLANRSNFNYPILLGRQFLSDRILVDSGQAFTHRTRCPRS